MKYKIRQSIYITMRDGVRIATDIHLPKGLKDENKIPAIIWATRYHRSYELGILEKTLSFLGKKDKHKQRNEIFLNNGYAVVRVDVRGTGASFGTQDIPWSDNEIKDIDEIINWIVKQEWSNGKVATTGGSYLGNTAELVAINHNPALKIVAPMSSDFNPMELGMPGGICNSGFIELWHQSNKFLDKNDMQNFFITLGLTPFMAKIMKLLRKGVKPVDCDKRKKLLREAIMEHGKNIDISKLKDVECYDDRLGSTDEVVSYASPYWRKDKIESSEVPMHVQVGWMDASTVNGAISRFNTFSNIQEVYIGPWNHVGEFTDPFIRSVPEEVNGNPLSYIKGKVIPVFDRYCKDQENPIDEKIIHYYVLGLGKWKTSRTYPVKDTTYKKMYLSKDNELSFEGPINDNGAFDCYKVDYTATTGESNRWHGQLGKKICYPDRREEDKKLLCYTSAGFSEDTEVTGNIILNLFLQSTCEDNAIHVYFEDVAPDGTVTYITEGLLRGVHRKIGNDKRKYYTVGPYHSFEREDMRPMNPKNIEVINIEMYATSVLIKKGHKIRIALSGYDGSFFDRYPLEGDPIWQVHRSMKFSSNIEVPFITAKD